VGHPRGKSQKFFSKAFVTPGDENYLEGLLNILEFGYNLPRFSFSRPTEIDQEQRKVLLKSEARAQR